MRKYYTISSAVEFSPTDNKLLFVQNGKSITLTVIESKLLEFLLQHRNSIPKRDEILELVFEDSGISPSYANLSRNIMLLRKAIISLGYENNIIITVPKVGFRISPDIEVKFFDDDEKTEPSKRHISQHTGKSGVTCVIVSGLFFIFSCAFFAYKYFYFVQNKPPLTQIETSIKQNKCTFHFIKDSQLVDLDKISKEIISTGRSLNCDEENDIYIWREKSNGVSRRFTAICDREHCGGIYDQIK